tara:strand:+ start:4290 stop:5168 length:879 start_codon:yes stop_codon:yes gene_type:complete
MNHNNEVKTIVFPVAGIGSRFLPATKSVAKELLPVLNRPLIEYAVEEAINSGIEKFIFITSPSKQNITGHFKINTELQELIKIKDKILFSSITKYLLPEDKVIEVTQSEPRGLGHAIWCARQHIDNKPFAVILPDDLVVSKEPCIKQLLNIYNKRHNNIIALKEVNKSDTSKYGIIEYLEYENNTFNISNMIEKPEINKAPSNLAIIGRYILLPQIIDELSTVKAGHGGEIQLTDALKNALNNSGVIGYKFEGNRYDCGNVVGSLEAQIALALENKNYKNDIAKLISKYNKL